MRLDKQKTVLAALSSGKLFIGKNGLSIFGSSDRRVGHHHRDGYCCISVPTGGDMEEFSCSAAQIVWLHAHGEIPDGLFVSYLDGDRKNHHLSNLILRTRKEINKIRVERLKAEKGVENVESIESHSRQ